jgi:hypothetical protein
MPEAIADPPSPCCSKLLSEPRIEASQSLGPDRFLPRARALRRGKLGQSARPAARHPQSHAARARSCRRPLSPEALSNLLDRKPHLLRPLATQVLPPPRAATDPAERLGIDLSSLRKVEDFRQVLATVMTAVARGRIATPEAARVARRVRARSRALRRCARLTRRLARKPSPAQPPLREDARV